MPMHDWSKTDAGNWHDFHQAWTSGLRNALNDGVLPPGYYSQIERKAEGMEPDLLTLFELNHPQRGREGDGGAALMTMLSAPVVQKFHRADEDTYTERANRIKISNEDQEVVALIEIVSPRNKSSRPKFAEFLEKIVDFIKRGIHVLIIDPFEPGFTNPGGIHVAVWSAFRQDPVKLDPAKPLVNVSYFAGVQIHAAVHCIAVGEEIPSMPLFLSSDQMVKTPLEATYMATWRTTAPPVRRLLDKA